MNVPGQPAGRHDWESLTPEAACTLAAWVVDRAVDVREVLEARLNWQEHRQLSLRSLLIGKEMLGMVGRRSHHRQVRLALRSLPFALQQKLNVVDAAGNVVTYRQIEKAMNQITEILADPTVLVDHDHPGADPETGEVIVCPVTCPFMVADHNWYVTAMAQASRPDDIPVADDMCMDWTDVETWAKPLYQFVPDAPRADGDVGDDYHSAVVSPEPQTSEVVSPEPQTSEAVSAEPQTKRATRAGVSGSTKPLAPLGPDGRRVPTKDSDGRYGHRSRRPGMSPNFVGWDNNTLVGAPDRDGGAMAPFLYAAALVPASSYAGDSATTLLRLARHFGVGVRDLIADRGYTRLDPARFSEPVRQMVDNIVLDLLDAQRRRGVDYTVVRDKGKPSQRTIRIKRIAGGFFASGLPNSMDNLARPPFAASRAERQANMAAFDKRAQFAFVRHDRTKAGTQRWAGPATAYAGFKVRCPNNDRSMRAPHTRPLTSCKKGTPCSCGEVVVIDDPSSEREQQRLLWGTTKWTKSYGRRTAVERAYADDKFQVTTFDRKSIYCFGTVKHAFYYTPTIVARNLQVALRWYRDQGQADPWGIEAMCQPGYEAPSEPEPSPDGGDGGGGDSGPAAALDEAYDDRPVESAEDDGDDDLAEATSNGTRDPNRAQRRAADRRERSRQRVAKPPKPPPRTPPTPEMQ